MSDGRSEASPWIEGLARVGFVGKGLLYVTVGTLAGCAGLGYGGETTDTRGAMGKLLELPLGRALLVGMTVGLIGYAVWRIVQGITDPDRRGSDAKGIALRGSFVVRGLVHLWLAYSAAQAAMGHPSGDSGARSKEAAATALSLPKGEWLAMLVAVGIAAFGLFQIYKGLTAKLNRDVDQGEARQEVGGWVIVASRAGIAARGIVFVAIGWLLGRAARQHDPSRAGGIADALGALTQLGKWPFVAIALGLVAYGFYQFLSARYRRIRA